MITLTFPYFFVRDGLTPSRTVSYEFDLNHEYNGCKVLSISYIGPVEASSYLQ